jgi:hypothetical protein
MGKIKFDDIQVGDEIQVTYPVDDIIQVRIGVVGSISQKGVHSPEGVYFGELRLLDASIELLNRTRPEFPTEVGSVITNVQYELRGVQTAKVAILTDSIKGVGSIDWCVDDPTLGILIVNQEEIISFEGVLK